MSSLAPGQLIGLQDALTCCNNNGSCMYAVGAQSCPSGYQAQYCCMPDGSVTSAVYMRYPAGSNENVSFCPTAGALQTTDLSQCSATSTKQCCYEGTCYPSKKYLGPNCYAGGPTFGRPLKPAGKIVDGCVNCPPAVTCCQKQDLNSVCYRQGSCNPGDLQVDNCGQCPVGLPTGSNLAAVGEPTGAPSLTASLLTSYFFNKNWMV